MIPKRQSLVYSWARFTSFAEKFLSLQVVYSVLCIQVSFSLRFISALLLCYLLADSRKSMNTIDTRKVLLALAFEQPVVGDVSLPLNTDKDDMKLALKGTTIRTSVHVRFILVMNHIQACNFCRKIASFCCYYSGIFVT